MIRKRFPIIIASVTIFALLGSATSVRAQQSWPGQMWAWLGGQLATAGQQMAVNNIFPTSIATPINNAVSVYSKLNDLVNNIGVGGLQKEMQGDLTPFNNLNNDLSNWVSNALLPGYMKNLVPNTLSLMDYVDQKATSIENGVNNFTNQVDQKINDLKSYFSGNDGLAAGSPEAVAAQTANLSSPGNVASTLESEYGADPTEAQQMASSVIEDGTVASARSGASGIDEEYPDAPGPPPPGPNSERDTDYSSVTVAPVPMTSTDPNSCIRTSNALGVGSVSIDCNSSAAPKPAEESPDSAEDEALLAAANQRMNAQEAGQAQALTQSQNMANAAAMQYLAQAQASGPVNMSKGGGACSAPGIGSGALRCENIVAAGICDRARKLEACMSAAIPSCGGCAACISQAQSMIASARATAASVCN